MQQRDVEQKNLDEGSEYEPELYIVLQCDKSTCQTYNLRENVFGYFGVATKRTQAVLDKMMLLFGVFIFLVVQPTHCFDINGPDALEHSAQKRKMRSYPAPLCQEHIIRDFKRACSEACTDRLIQRCFVRALRRDKNGDIDKSLIPSDILAWYEDSDDEEDTFEECSSDVEWSIH